MMIKLRGQFCCIPHKKKILPNFFYNIFIVHHAGRRHKELDFVEYHIEKFPSILVMLISFFLTYTFRVASFGFSLI